MAFSNLGVVVDLMSWCLLVRNGCTGIDSPVRPSVAGLAAPPGPGGPGGGCRGADPQRAQRADPAERHAGRQLTVLGRSVTRRGVSGTVRGGELGGVFFWVSGVKYQ